MLGVVARGEVRGGEEQGQQRDRRLKRRTLERSTTRHLRPHYLSPLFYDLPTNYRLAPHSSLDVSAAEAPVRCHRLNPSWMRPSTPRSCPYPPPRLSSTASPACQLHRPALRPRPSSPFRHAQSPSLQHHYALQPIPQAVRGNDSGCLHLLPSTYPDPSSCCPSVEAAVGQLGCGRAPRLTNRGFSSPPPSRCLCRCNLLLALHPHPSQPLSRPTHVAHHRRLSTSLTRCSIPAMSPTCSLVAGG